MSSSVLLVSMPFGPINSPSIGLSLLKGVLNERGVPTDILYLNLLFAKEMGVSFYNVISSGYPVNHDMLGEWIFSGTLFGNHKSTDEYIYNILQGNDSAHSKHWYGHKQIDEKFVNNVLSAKEKASRFIDSAVELIMSKRPAIVGFTSVFQQQIASLAVAQKIKKLDSDIIICMGGANNEGVMGNTVIKKFDFIDYVVSGEGEYAFPNLVSDILSGHPKQIPAGVSSQVNISHVHAKQGVDIDKLPYVDYDDYFDQLNGLGIMDGIKPRVPFETSRGCWWGVKNHCTFCGLNGESMTQRTKSWERALAELKHILDKYPNYAISVVDNILDYRYFKNFIPALIELRKTREFQLFYEVKANLTKPQLKMLKEAGITAIQPGIESFCKKTLQLMRKGVSPIQNIQLLKWCKELNIRAEWNMLYGFPGENLEEYEEVKKILPSLFHMNPPSGFAPIRLDRFSPNFDESDALGFAEISPYPTYSYIYPFSDTDIANLAYFFTYKYQSYSLDVDFFKKFDDIVSKWETKHTESALFYSDNEDHLIIWDLRPRVEGKVFVLDEVSRSIYLLCDKAIRFEQCREIVKQEFYDLAEDSITSKIDFLVENKLLIAFENHYLSLAISDTNLEISKKVARKIKKLVARDGNVSSNSLYINKPIFA